MTRVKNSDAVIEDSNSKRGSKAKSKALGKRQAEGRSARSNAPISIVSKGQNKVAKFGAAAASVMAVSLALFGNQETVQDLPGTSLVSPQHDIRRNLMSIPSDNISNIDTEIVDFKSWNIDDQNNLMTSIQIYEDIEEP